MTATMTSPAAVPYRLRWPAFLVILTGSVMELLDATVTNIAGPAMQAELGGSTTAIQWLGVAYTLAMTAGLLSGGRLGDIVGRKRMFVIGMAGFVVGSLLCAVSVSPEMLVAARVVQGLFGAAMIPQGLGMMKEMFSPEELPKAFGVIGPVMTLSTVVGPILAGWLVDLDLFGTGWRMIFLINLPIGLVALLAAVAVMPATRPSKVVALDLPGAVLASLGALLIVFPLVQGREHNWPVWTFVMMAASVAVFVLFGWLQTRKHRAGGDPLVVPTLFRKRAFVGGMISGTAFFGGFVGVSLVLTLYVQLGLGYSPLEAGFAVVPMSIGMVVGMGLVRALRANGRWVLHAGAALMVIASAVMALVLGVDPVLLFVALFVVGVGAGLFMGPYFDIVLAGVSPDEAGSASGALTSIQQVGAALGVALLGTVYFDGGDPATAARSAFWVVTGIALLTFAVAFLLPKRAPQHLTATSH